MYECCDLRISWRIIKEFWCSTSILRIKDIMRIKEFWRNTSILRIEFQGLEDPD